MMLWCFMGKQFKLGAALLLATGTFTISLATPANAAACFTISLLGALTTPYNCTTGGFSFTLNSYSGFTVDDRLTISTTGNSFNFRAAPTGDEWTPGTQRVFNYTIVAPSDRLLSNYSSSLGSTNPSTLANFNLVGSAGNAQATITAGNVGTNGGKTFGTPLSSDTFTATLNVTAGDVININTSYQLALPVPGPLPILGASAAFGLSRKLRQRIKAIG